MKHAGLFGLALTALLFAAAPPSRAETWPSRPVTLIVPFGAGTTSDVIARAFSQSLSESLGQPVIVENKGGAGGNIAAAFVAHSDPNGYTLLFATTGPAATNKLMYQHMDFDPERDFAPVVLVGKSPVIIVARPDAPFSTLKEFLDYARANPRQDHGGLCGKWHARPHHRRASAALRIDQIQPRAISRNRRHTCRPPGKPDRYRH